MGVAANAAATAPRSKTGSRWARRAVIEDTAAGRAGTGAPKRPKTPVTRPILPGLCILRILCRQACRILRAARNDRRPRTPGGVPPLFEPEPQSRRQTREKGSGRSIRELGRRRGVRGGFGWLRRSQGYLRASAELLRGLQDGGLGASPVGYALPRGDGESGLPLGRELGAERGARRGCDEPLWRITRYRTNGYGGITVRGGCRCPDMKSLLQRNIFP